MSHVVTIKTTVKDAAAVRVACQRLGLPQPVQGTHRLFTSSATGLGVQLTGWRYPVVCHTDTGQLEFDNFKGHWGNSAKLDQFLQAYAVERAKAEARRRGHQVTEAKLSDGSIKLTVQVNGGTA
ncbi:MAG: DUF1257 domain-containing protein [Planctomycetota bacterium]|nr:DUF1257 domain-containing protein [Planctomycetota bacterium]